MEGKHVSGWALDLLRRWARGIARSLLAAFFGLIVEGVALTQAIPFPPERGWATDGVSVPDSAPWPANSVDQLLGAWSFDSADLTTGFSEGPWWATNAVLVPGNIGTALRLNTASPAAIRFSVRQGNTDGDFSVRNGTAAFWFRPAWSTGSRQAPVVATPILEVGANRGDRIGWWALRMEPGGKELSFLTQAAGQESSLLRASANFVSNSWTHVALTWSPTQSALYLNGQRVAQGLGVTLWPALAERERWGWGIGGDGTGALQIRGDYDTLLTFNYPLSAATISRLAYPGSKSGGKGYPGLDGLVESESLQENGSLTGLWIQPQYTGMKRQGWLQGTYVGLAYELFGAGQLPGPWQMEQRFNGQAQKTWFELTADARPTLFLVAASFADQDGDGLSDEYERRVSGTRPDSTDTDQDGMPDDWELNHGLNPLLATDDAGDPDNDGFPNEMEYRLGRDPQVAEGVPLVTVTASAAMVSEASAGAQFVVHRTTPINRALEVFFELRGRAANGGDYEWIPNRVTLPAGASQASVAVKPIDDSLDELSETVILELVTGAEYGLGSSRSATLTLTDNDLPVVSIQALDPEAREPQMTWTNPGEFEVRREGLTAQALTVVLKRSGTAVAGTDDLGTPGTVVIPAGEVAVKIPVTPRNNGISTGTRTLILQIASNAAYSSAAQASSATVSIQDIQPPVVSVAASDPDAGEKRSPTSAANPGSFKFSRTGSTGQALTVRYRVGGTAIAKSSSYSRADYPSLPGVVVIPEGQLDQLVTLTPFEDALEETLETVTVVLGGSLDYAIGTSAEATITIDDNSPPRVNSRTLAACSGRTSGPFALIEATRSGSASSTLTVPLEVRGLRLWNSVWYDFKNVPAAAGASYGLFVDGQPAVSLTFPPGVTRRVISLKAMHPVATVPNAILVIDPAASAQEHPVQFIDPEDQVTITTATSDVVEGTAWIVSLIPGSSSSGPDGTTVRLGVSGGVTAQDYTVTGATVEGNELVVKIPPTVSGANNRQVLLKITPKADGISEIPSEHLVLTYNQTQTGSGLVASQQGKPYVAARVRDSGDPLVLPLDVDGDGLPDDFEIANGTDPLKPTEFLRDSDRDGIGDREELLHGTNPFQADTDGDGLSDFVEGMLGLDPLKKDSAGVGLEPELVPIRLRTAGSFREANNSCYRCHAPGMDVGYVSLTTETAEGGSATGGVLERVVLLRTGTTHEITLTPPPNLSPTGKSEIYDAEILPVATGAVPGFVVLDNPDSLLGKSRVYNATTFTRKATLRVLTPPRLAVDADHDGTIRFDSSDATTALRPYRFWVNNDHDAGDSVDNLNSSTQDHSDFRISCRRDLEDFSRLWIDVENFRDLLSQSGFEFALEWRNVVGGAPALQIYPSVEADGGLAYLQNENTAAQQSLPNATLPSFTWAMADTGLANRTIKSGNRFVFQRSTWSTQPKRLHLIFEAAALGRGELVALLLRNGQILTESRPLHLHFLDVKQMYQRAEATPADGFPPPYLHLFSDPPIPNIGFTVEPFAKDPGEAPSLVTFVHGWNTTPEESINTAETMYKRLWHQSFRGRFAFFRWPTDVLSKPEWLDRDLFDSFDLSEHRAWLYGEVLKAFLEQAPPEMARNVVSHSMGGIVLASALRNGAVCRNGIFMQAAIPAGALDPAPQLDHDRLLQAEAGTYAPFKTPDRFIPDRGYRGAIDVTDVRLFNYYNANDFALETGSFVFGLVEGNWIVNQIKERPHSPSRNEGFIYSWPGSMGPLPGRPMFRLFRPVPETYYGREVTEQAEIWAFAARSRSRALGAEGRTRNLFTAEQTRNLADWGVGFSRPDHSVQFTRHIQPCYSMYGQLLIDLERK